MTAAPCPATYDKDGIMTTPQQFSVIISRKTAGELSWYNLTFAVLHHVNADPDYLNHLSMSAPSCRTWYDWGYRTSSTFNIDPDGEGGGEEAFPVECDFSDSDLPTDVSHDVMMSTAVPAANCTANACNLIVTYTGANISQVRDLGRRIRRSCVGPTLSRQGRRRPMVGIA